MFFDYQTQNVDKDAFQRPLSTCTRLQLPSQFALLAAQKSPAQAIAGTGLSEPREGYRRRGSFGLGGTNTLQPRLLSAKGSEKASLRAPRTTPR